MVFKIYLQRQLDASGLLGKGSVDSDRLSTHSLDLDKDVGRSKGFSDEKERPQYWSLLNLRTEIRNVVTTLRSGGGRKHIHFSGVLFRMGNYA